MTTDPLLHLRKVWIVDDSPMEAELARKSLASKFQTRVFSDGSTLLEQITASPLPDVLVLDWMMPGITGIDVCKFLRTLDATSELSIVLLTSQSQTQQVVEGFEAGASDYLIKPYSPAELVARVSSQIRALSVRERSKGVDQQAAAALRKTEQRYRALIDGLPELLIVSSQGRIVFLNQHAIDELSQGRPELLIGKPLATILQDGEPQATLPGVRERRLARSDGTVITVELSAQSVVFDGEQAMVLSARDITRQKRVQSQLLVAERMATVGMLAAGVAHEINNPLTSVLANLEFARGELARTFDQSPAFRELEQSLSDARVSGERVRDIVSDLRIFSRSDDAERLDAVDVTRVLELSLRMASNQIRHGATLVQDFQAVPAVLANDARLGQVFLNLIVNAAQAMSGEGGAAKNELRVATRMVGDRVAVEICDTGAGMTPAVIDRLFTPFFTTKPVGVGTGLGLSICHRIVSGLGGEIQVESEVGKGSTFRVLLQVAPPSAAGVPAQAPPAQVTHARAKVLVVDDELMIVTAIKRILGREHDVTGVTLAQDALDQITAGARFDVILCDLMMPQMTGIELHSKLLALAPDQARRIVFLSGGVFATSASAGHLPNRQLGKPFDGKGLKELIAQCFRDRG